MTRRNRDEEEREREADDGGAGCFLEGLFYAGEGCLWAAIPCVAALFWVLS